MGQKRKADGRGYVVWWWASPQGGRGQGWHDLHCNSCALKNETKRNSRALCPLPESAINNVVFMRRELQVGPKAAWPGHGFYNRSMKLFRLRTRRALRLPPMPASPPSLVGKGGSSIMGSRSSAPRATIFFCAGLRGDALGKVGTGGISGLGPRCVGGRDNILEFLRSLFIGEELDTGGAVCGVMGENGVAGVGGMFPDLPWILESHFLVEGVMAILASDSFCEIERRRLCGPDLMIGDAALVIVFSYGSELRKE